MTEQREAQRSNAKQNPNSDNGLNSNEFGGNSDGAQKPFTKFFGRFLCMLGLHDDRIIDATFGFGPGGNVERVVCKRCGRLATQWV